MTRTTSPSEGRSPTKDKGMGRSDHKDGRRLFRTRDLPLAAFLALNGHDHVAMERRGNVGYWIFNRNNELENLLTEYNGGNVRLNVKDYMDCVHDVRGDLYSYMGMN